VRSFGDEALHIQEDDETDFGGRNIRSRAMPGEEESVNNEERQVPTATDWLLDLAPQSEQPPIRSTYMVWSTKTGRKGTAFSLSTGPVVTCEHVIQGSAPQDLVLIASTGQRLAVKDMVVNADLDLAALQLTRQPTEGFRIQTAAPRLEQKVRTWGYPLAYNGPSPILAVGYVAGFNPFRRRPGSPIVKHFVVNGAFNPGNSGGPLIAEFQDAIVGVVVSKHAPISGRHLSALEALKNQKSGAQFPAMDAEGNEFWFSEAHLVGDLLQYFRDMTQVVIGEAIAAQEVVKFLDAHGFAWKGR